MTPLFHHQCVLWTIAPTKGSKCHGNGCLLIQALFLNLGDPSRPGFLDSIGMRSGQIWQRLKGAPLDVYSITQSATQVSNLLRPALCLAVNPWWNLSLAQGAAHDSQTDMPFDDFGLGMLASLEGIYQSAKERIKHGVIFCCAGTNGRGGVPHNDVPLWPMMLALCGASTELPQ